MTPIQQILGPWWQERSVRERRILVVWAVAVVALSLWFGVCAPLFARIAVLEKQVPELEMLLNRMRTPATAKIPAATTTRSSDEDLRSTMYAWLAESRISAELRALSPTRVEMRLPEMPMRDALDALDTLRQQTGARVAVFGARSDGASAGTARVIVELERNP
jgi:type II secretory pathway component PulM